MSEVRARHHTRHPSPLPLAPMTRLSATYRVAPLSEEGTLGAVKSHDSGDFLAMRRKIKALWSDP